MARTTSERASGVKSAWAEPRVWVLVAAGVVLAFPVAGRGKMRSEKLEPPTSPLPSKLNPPLANQPAAAPPATSPSATTQPAAPVLLKATDAEGLRANIGKRTKISGKVSRAELSKSGKVFRIEFEGTRDSGFMAVIFDNALKPFTDTFGPDLKTALTGKSVEVSGALVEYKEKPEIILNDPAQLQILASPAPSR